MIAMVYLTKSQFAATGCLEWIQTMGIQFLNKAGQKKLPKIYQSFCSPNKICDPFLSDADLDSTVVLLPDAAIKDPASMQGVRMLKACSWIFTDAAPTFKHLLQGSASDKASPGACSCWICEQRPSCLAQGYCLDKHASLARTFCTELAILETGPSTCMA